MKPIAEDLEGGRKPAEMKFTAYLRVQGLGFTDLGI